MIEDLYLKHPWTSFVVLCLAWLGFQICGFILIGKIWKRRFNLLQEELSQKDQALRSFLARQPRPEAHPLLDESERARYQTLGALSGLVIHDLASPLHVAHFCVTSLKENPLTPNPERYLSRLHASIDRAIELVASLRARLKNPDYSDSVSFEAVLANVVRVLHMEFGSSGFSSSLIETSEEVRKLQLKIPPVEAIQIFDNLCRKGRQKSWENHIFYPQIHISLVRCSMGLAEIRIKTKELEECRLNSDSKPLDLNLMTRLIEYRGGSLSIENSEEESLSYLLKLPVETQTETRPHPPQQGTYVAQI